MDENRDLGITVGSIQHELLRVRVAVIGKRPTIRIVERQPVFRKVFVVLSRDADDHQQRKRKTQTIARFISPPTAGSGFKL